MTDRREPGYRGSLPPREDRLARIWVVAVAGIFVAVVVLSILGLPSRLIPEPTPIPVPSVPAPSSAPPSGSAAPTSPPTPPPPSPSSSPSPSQSPQAS